jgi:transposase
MFVSYSGRINDLRLLLLLPITFMQDIHNYMPETNCASGVYSSAAAKRATCNVISHAGYSAPSYQHFPQFVRSAQYGWFMHFLNFVLFQYVAQVLRE